MRLPTLLVFSKRSFKCHAANMAWMLMTMLGTLCLKLLLVLYFAVATVREPNSDEEAEQDPLRDTVSGHKSDLEALREQDPQFYDYLKEADSDLLAFGDGMDLSSSDDEASEGLEVRPLPSAHSLRVACWYLKMACTATMNFGVYQCFP